MLLRLAKLATSAAMMTVGFVCVQERTTQQPKPPPRRTRLRFHFPVDIPDDNFTFNRSVAMVWWFPNRAESGRRICDRALGFTTQSQIAIACVHVVGWNFGVQK
jgi:hypothetical protein